MKQFLETIGAILFDSELDQEYINKLNKDLITIKESYVLIKWPEVQELMEEEWFNDEAILEVSGKFGNSAYFIPIKYLIK